MSSKYGDYLYSKRYFEESALTYWSVGLHREACGGWEKSLDWRRCLMAAGAASFSEGETRELCKRLAGDLKTKGRLAEAATVLRERLGDPEEALAALVEGQLWAEADRIIAEERRGDLYGMCGVFWRLPAKQEAALNVMISFLFFFRGHETKPQILSFLVNFSFEIMTYGLSF